MSAGNEEQKIGRPQSFGQSDGQRVRLQVVDGDKRFAVGERDGFGRHQSDDETAVEAGTGRRGNGIELRQCDLCFAKCGRNDLVQALDMCARSNFGHNTAIGSMLFPLGSHHIGKDPAMTVQFAQHHARGGFVAARFDTKHEG